MLTKHQVPLIRQDIQAIDLSQLESAATKNQASVDSIEKTVPQILQIANDHASALSQLDYKMKYLIGGDIAKIGKAIEAVDQALSKGRSGNHKRRWKATQRGFQISLFPLESPDIPKRVQFSSLEKLQNCDNATGSVRDAVEHISAKINDNTALLSNIKNDLISSAEMNSSTIHTLSSNILNLDATMGQTTTAVRVNGAALARIDKDEINDLPRNSIKQSHNSTNCLMTTVRESVESPILFFPKIESEMKGIHSSLERLTHNNVDGLRRTRDALAVIGTKIAGTSRKFDDLVDAVHSSDDLDHSSPSKTFGGNGKVPGELRILGTRRSRGGSNASIYARTFKFIMIILREFLFFGGYYFPLRYFICCSDFHDICIWEVYGLGMI
ncbi:hypothetical protein DID88_001093 [Monilinia fructigena]|uniref:Uncharacterized protein n=1 Tax=Monilinia fructigena TaxID=38457 RepID=A0A395IZ39_9HELO|nr:hypothetical protein DID88_001093 [Monilinia fructigena]